MGDGVNVSAALDQVVVALQAKFGDVFKTVAAEDASRDELVTPAILVEVAQVEPRAEQDPMQGQMAALVHLHARVVVDVRTPKARRLCATYAAAVAVAVHNERLGVEWLGGIPFACEPDEFAPDLEQAVVWRVEWAHSCYLGVPVLDEGVVPSTVLISRAPEIGPAHEDDYSEIVS